MATPTNAIIFASGYVKTKDMVSYLSFPLLVASVLN